MTHVIEPAPTSRAKCRGCGLAIEKQTLRFGERQPNAFGDGEMTLWFHPLCAAYKRPEPFLEALDAAASGAAGSGPAERGTAASGAAALDDADALRTAAKFGIEHRRVPRVDGAERAPTGRARCRSCREAIAKDSWRIPLVFFEEYRFEPSGFIHAACAREYFGTTDIMPRVRRFNPGLSAAELDAVTAALEDSPPTVSP